jgi:hypothetical protein
MQKHSLLRIGFHSSESKHIISTNMERKKKDRKALFILQLKSRTDALELVYQHKGEKCHDLLIQIRGKKIGPGLSTLNISCKAFRLSTAFSKPITYIMNFQNKLRYHIKIIKIKYKKNIRILNNLYIINA